MRNVHNHTYACAHTHTHADAYIIMHAHAYEPYSDLPDTFIGFAYVYRTRSTKTCAWRTHAHLRVTCEIAIVGTKN